MSEPSEFLLARLAEDEAVAQVSADDRFDTDSEGHWVFVTADCEGTAPQPPGDNNEGRNHWVETSGWAVHASRHDPARVLAEVEAKRRIVELHAEEQTRADIYNEGYDDGILNENDLGMRARSNARARGLKEAVLALAAIYSDHPDYDEAWRA